jgi:hypothetical protein
MITVQRIDSDELREIHIRSELANMQACKALGNTAQAAVHWTNAARLIKARSPERVRQMERERGIA